MIHWLWFVFVLDDVVKLVYLDGNGIALVNQTRKRAEDYEKKCRVC